MESGSKWTIRHRFLRHNTQPTFAESASTYDDGWVLPARVAHAGRSVCGLRQQQRQQKQQQQRWCGRWSLVLLVLRALYAVGQGGSSTTPRCSEDGNNNHRRLPPLGTRRRCQNARNTREFWESEAVHSVISTI